MDRTVVASVVVGAGCLVLCAVGAGCVGYPNKCPVEGAYVIPMAIVAVASLVPVVAIWVAAFIDSRRRSHSSSKSKPDELTSLVPSTSVSDAAARIPVYMYASHFMSSWGDRMWQFAIPLLFMEIFVDTLLPSALFSLVVYIVGVATVPVVGAWIDHTNRLRVMRVSILIENGCIIASTIALGSILYVLSSEPATTTPGVHWSWPMIGLFGVTVVAGAVGQAYTDAQTLSIQQDWVVVVARETGVPLGDWNASLRRIDLICKLASPVAFGLIMDFAGDAPMTRAATGAAVVGVWNLLAAPLEYCMRVDTYHFVPALHDQPNQLKKKPTLNFTQYFASWTEYFNHPTFLASFSFCALYMTVLTGDGLNSAYLQWRGVPLSLLGLSSGLGGLFGFLGTLLFPVLLACLGSIERVSVWSVWCFWATLVPVWVACVWYGESSVSDYIMMVAVLFSRMWLWSCDLGETQIMQEWVEADRRGTMDKDMIRHVILYGGGISVS
ncbi:hypothetical protein, variant [Aphanomyces astaci]|uniref:Solute carrier family 40 member n=1 Tax=Aphanomyces astaci TaxID=112090 RepID=W4G7A9_APHAT|nr:hypothetical protein, variant [Aphanomyces astaci]ETV74954.1 hypothetical protein, variant [Aphanomyces astaci]|eukprot:XP_009835457.1 hypothetical protein, variant [Aphanomyces astaci]